MINQMKYVSILSVPFLCAARTETVEHVANRIINEQKMHVITANPEIVMLAVQDPVYMQTIQQADIITPDGIGVVMASRWIGEPLPERVAGYELLHAIMEKANQHGWTYALVGAAPDVCQGAVSTLQKMYPQARCVAHFDGYFTSETEKNILVKIQQEKPHILFVALGAPRQEQWIRHHWDELPVQLAMGVGGSFDVLSGKVKRAPVFWQKTNLEWLYRLLSQPKRWRRQLLLPKFAVTVLWRKVMGK